MLKKKLLLLLLPLLALLAYFALDLHSYLDPDYLQSRREALLAYSDERFWLSRMLYFLIYIVVAALSLPAAALLTLLGGAVFGFWWGLLLVSFASSIGATLAFLLARTLLRDWVQGRFSSYLAPLNRGIERDGAFYLFTLRLVPLFPFFLVNLVMGLTPIRVWVFYSVSQLGMLLGTAVYVNVGARLGLVTSLPDVLSPGLLAAIAILAVFPWLARALLRAYRARRALRGYRKPRRFDTNLVVIGAGSAGLVTAYIAALAQAKVTLVEKQRMGGDCLNTGCVPSKALLRSAGVARLLRRADEFGLKSSGIQTDFPAVMQRVREVIDRIAPHDSVERYTALGVDCLSGEAKVVSPWRVRVGEREITTRAIVIASGASPRVPALPGLEQVGYITSDSVWELETLPRRLLVLGGGPVGCELAQAFARLGSEVTIVNRRSRLLPREDPEVSSLLEAAFAAEGIEVLNDCEPASFAFEGGSRRAALRDGRHLQFDTLLLALGRQANVEGLGLEDFGIGLNSRGTLEVNEYLQSACPTIYACGDVVGPFQFTHMASFQAWFASINSLFSGLRRFPVHYRVVPQAVFCDPEVARVGLSEQEALARNIPYELVCYDLEDLDRAIVEGENRGFVRVLTEPGRDRILGATVAGLHAAELLQQFTLAMTHGLGLKKLMATVHVYPTVGESIRFAAGEWRRNHAPAWIYPWLRRLHAFRRKE